MLNKDGICILRRGLIILLTLIATFGVSNAENAGARASNSESVFLMGDITHVSLPGSRGIEPSPWIVWRDVLTGMHHTSIMTLDAMTGQQMGNRLERELPYDHTPAAISWCRHFSLTGKRGIEPVPWIVFRDYRLGIYPVTYAADGTPAGGAYTFIDLPISPTAYGYATSLAELPGTEFPDGLPRLFVGTENGFVIALEYGAAAPIHVEGIVSVAEDRIDDLEPIPQLGYISLAALAGNVIYGMNPVLSPKSGSTYSLLYSWHDPYSTAATDFDVFGAKDTALTNPEAPVRLILCHGNTELGLAQVSADESGTNSLSPVYDTQANAVSSVATGSLLMLLADASALLFDPKYSPETGSSGCAIDITDPVNDGCTIICGDANDDEAINLADAVFIINYVFKGGTPPDPLCVADANGDGAVNLAEAVHLINYIFKGGPPPVDPCCP